MVSQPLVELSDSDRARIESWLVEFDRSWTPELLRQRVSEFPSDGLPRQALLAELIKIDLERHWSKGARPLLESYLQQFPELGTPEELSEDLIEAELIVRHQFGDRPRLDELEERFPGRATTLRRLLQESGAAESQARALRQTHRTDGDTQSVATKRRAKGSVAVKASQGKMPKDSVAATVVIPPQFGRYKILRQLGAGAMGAVYLAHDTALNRKVALKTPTFAEGESSEMVERFQREARSAANLRHPNICPVYDVGEIEGIHYITMAYIEGRPLSTFINPDKPLSERAAAAVVRKLALALDHAHTHGVIHRDLKPENIMIDQQREPLVMDFGLARQIDQPGELRVTQTGMILGTPAYMSPEQVDSQRHEVGPASDLYSLGVILYELLTGQLPYQGNFASVLAQILTREPTRPSECRPGLDPRLEAICLQMMAKEVGDRFASMKEAADALTEYLKSAGAPGEGATRSIAVKQADQEALAALAATGGRNSLVRRPTRRESSPGWKTLARTAGRQLRGWRATLAGSLFGMSLLAAVFLLRTSHGTVRIEVSDPSLSIVLDGDQVAIQGLREPLELKAGLHVLTVHHEGKEIAPGDTLSLEPQNQMLRVTYGDVTLRGNEFTVAKGENRILRIEMLPLEPPQLKHSNSVRGTKYALRFDGEKSHVRIPDFRYDGSTPLTVEAFVTPQDTAGSVAADCESGGWAIGIDHRTCRWAFRVATSAGEKTALSKESIVIGRRVHIAGVLLDKQIQLFIDGQLQETTTLEGQLRTSGLPTIVGADPRNEAACHGWFKGLLDGLRISRSARYSTAFAPPSSLEPDAHTSVLLCCEEGSGAVANDTSGNEHHGHLIGAIWDYIAFAAEEPAEERSRHAADEYSLQFDGKSRLVIPSFRYDGDYPITLEAFVVVQGTSSERYSDAIIGDIEGGGVHLTRELFIVGTSSGYAMAKNEGALPLHERAHIAGIFDGTSVTLFVNGKRIASSPARGRFKASGFPFLVGANPWSGSHRGQFHLRGIVEQVRISHAARYSTDFVPETILAADEKTRVLLSLNEGAGTTAYDSSDNGHDGIIVGAKWMRRSHTGGWYPVVDPSHASHSQVAELDLLAFIDHSAVRPEGGRLLTVRDDGKGIDIPFELPREMEEYDLTVDLIRRRGGRGNDLGFGVRLPLPRGGLAEVYLDGYFGSGLNGIDGLDYKNPAVNFKGKLLRLNYPATVVIEVRRNRISVIADGRKIIDWCGDVSRIKHDRSRGFLIAAHKAEFDVTKLSLSQPPFSVEPD